MTLKRHPNPGQIRSALHDLTSVPNDSAVLSNASTTNNLDTVFGEVGDEVNKSTPYNVVLTGVAAGSTFSTCDYLYGVNSGIGKKMTPLQIVTQVFGALPPTTDPLADGQIWIDSGVWKLSAGS